MLYTKGKRYIDVSIASFCQLGTLNHHHCTRVNWSISLFTSFSVNSLN